MRDPRPTAAPWAGLALLLALICTVLLLRHRWEPRVAPGVLVEVRGEVDLPGFHVVPIGTVRSALAVAGGPSDGADGLVPAGHLVLVSDGAVAVQPPRDPLLVARPVDVNQALQEALQTVPGLGPSTAAAIVADRDDNGLFYALDDLERVRGIGPATLQRLTRYLTVGAPGPRPPPARIDLNHATALRLQALPGIGPVTARRIVADREQRGPFPTVDALVRVRGIGPAKLAAVRDIVQVGP